MALEYKIDFGAKNENKYLQNGGLKAFFVAWVKIKKVKQI